MIPPGSGSSAPSPAPSATAEERARTWMKVNRSWSASTAPSDYASLTEAIREAESAAAERARRGALEEAIEVARANHQPPCTHSCGACRNAKDIQTRLRSLLAAPETEEKKL